MSSYNYVQYLQFTWASGPSVANNDFILFYFQDCEVSGIGPHPLICGRSFLITFTSGPHMNASGGVGGKRCLQDVGEFIRSTPISSPSRCTEPTGVQSAYRPGRGRYNSADCGSSKSRLCFRLRFRSKNFTVVQICLRDARGCPGERGVTR